MSHTLAEQTVRDARSYEDACRRHAWKIPRRYNIAWDVCDRHADGTGRRALLWVGGEGAAAQHSFDDIKCLSDRLASGLRTRCRGRRARGHDAAADPGASGRPPGHLPSGGR